MRPALGADAIWKEGTGRPLTLVISKTGLAAVGVTPAVIRDKKADDEAKRGPTAAVSEDQRRMPRTCSKLAIVIAMLRRDEGATVEEMAAATGWAHHTVKGVMSGARAKKFEMRIVSKKVEGRGGVYRASKE